MNINYDRIDTLDKALEVIHKLNRGIENCYGAQFRVCEKCGEIYTEGYICWHCGYDNESREDKEE